MQRKGPQRIKMRRRRKTRKGVSPRKASQEVSPRAKRVKAVLSIHPHHLRGVVIRVMALTVVAVRAGSVEKTTKRIEIESLGVDDVDATAVADAEVVVMTVGAVTE